MNQKKNEGKASTHNPGEVSEDSSGDDSEDGSVRGSGRAGRITLKDVARRAGVSTATVSLVINQAPKADAIPDDTQQRVLAAARELNYRPNYLARSLRSQRSHTIGVLLPEVSEGYNAGILTGLERRLLEGDYVYLVAGHRSRPELLKKYVSLFRDRLVEGLVLINTPLGEPYAGGFDLPTVAVAGHEDVPGTTNVVIDHSHAAHAALGHLADLGHRRIAVFKGHPGSADTEERMRSIRDATEDLGIELPSEFILQLSGEESSQTFTPEEGYEEGYAFGRRLLERGEFSALFAFNDVSAIGAMRAFLDAGFDVPGDISVVGFDDIQSAAFFNPSLTTVRQPLEEMGRIAGDVLLHRLRDEEVPPEVTVEPELVVRNSTGPPPEHLRRVVARVARSADVAGE